MTLVVIIIFATIVMKLFNNSAPAVCPSYLPWGTLATHYEFRHKASSGENGSLDLSYTWSRRGNAL